MRIATGKVVQGKLELDGGSLQEGVTVTVFVPELDETFELTPDEELALEEFLKQAAGGSSSTRRPSSGNFASSPSHRSPRQADAPRRGRDSAGLGVVAS